MVAKIRRLEVATSKEDARCKNESKLWDNILQIRKSPVNFRCTKYNNSIIFTGRSLVKVNQVGAVLSIIVINRIPNEYFGYRCSRGNDTLKRNRVPVKAK